MPSPLILGVNSLATVDEVSEYVSQYFNMPGVTAYEELIEDDPSTTYQKSYMLIRASATINSYLKRQSLQSYKDVYNQPLEYPRNGAYPEAVKEAVFIQALHILEYSQFYGSQKHTRTQTIGDLSTTVDVESLIDEMDNTSPFAVKILERSSEVFSLAVFTTSNRLSRV
ncbi:MAG: hypothetical protein HQM11_07685 [SAR324 cluster bacterium]|nr:hypothetical protein [SAR324 cluster bacterium]